MPPPAPPPNEKKSPGVSNNGSHITWITPNYMHWNGLIHILNVSKYIVAEREKQSLYHDQQIRVFILSYFLCNSIILIHFFSIQRADATMLVCFVILSCIRAWRGLPSIHLGNQCVFTGTPPIPCASTFRNHIEMLSLHLQCRPTIKQ